MTLPTEPIRYAGPSQTVVEPSAPQYLAASCFTAGILLLMALFVFSTDHFLHGWWWALFVFPAAFVVAGIAAGFAAVEAYR